MLKKLVKIALWILLLTIYLNIGWGLGYYFHYNIDIRTFESAPWQAKLLAGHCLSFGSAGKIEDRKGAGTLVSKISFSIFWPFTLLISLFSWLVHIVFWTLKFIFAGGLFKLVLSIS